MLVESKFDEQFLGLDCWRLEPPIDDADLAVLTAKRLRGELFADARLRSSDLEAARRLLALGFEKICVKIELHHDLRVIPDPAGMSSEATTLVDRLPLTATDIEAHAEHFIASRFRQDLRIPKAAAKRLYAKWIANSLSGGKRIIALGQNFCSFEDVNSVRTIDLLSVQQKRHGYAKRLVRDLVEDAMQMKLQEVHVITEVENAGALSVYRSVGFEIFDFFTCFHLWAAAPAQHEHSS